MHRAPLSDKKSAMGRFLDKTRRFPRAGVKDNNIVVFRAQVC